MHSRPYHPQTCAKVERFHQTLKRYLARQRRAATVAELQGQLDRFTGDNHHEHRHSGIGYHTPASVHYGTAAEVRAQRQAALDAAYAANPARFRHRRPEPAKLPTLAWINQPSIANDAE